jgi:hypothetical protein
MHKYYYAFNMSRRFELLLSQELSGYNSVTEVIEFIRYTLTRWNYTIASIHGNNIDMGTYDIRVFALADDLYEIKIFTLMPARGIWEDHYEKMLYKLYYQSVHKEEMDEHEYMHR